MRQVGVARPAEERMGIDVAKGRIPKKLEQQHPKNQERDKNPLKWNAFPYAGEVPPKLLQGAEPLAFFDCHSLARLQKESKATRIVAGFRHLTTPFWLIQTIAA